jgi:hypothetical protein
VQRGTALLTTSKTPSRIQENFDISTLPEDATKEISYGIKTRQRFNAVSRLAFPGSFPEESEVEAARDPTRSSLLTSLETEVRSQNSTPQLAFLALFISSTHAITR